MKELVEEINRLHLSFVEDANKFCEKNNKMAGRRARTTSNKITALLKTFRQQSLSEEKGEAKE